MPVDRNALVLDVGSGDKPHWRADVLLDKYIDEKYSAQRSGSKETRINHPMFDASAENMPFADKVFDYVICSHVLEHVTNPGKVIGEIMRVGKAGYIEVPFEGSSKITDFESHLWYCKKEENKLIFTAKKQAIFDLEIEKFISKNNIRKTFSKISTDNFDNFIVALYWKNTIEYAVIGEPNLEILNKSLNNSKEEYNNIIYNIRNIINFMFSIVFFSKKRNLSIMFNSIVKTKFKKSVDVILKKIIYHLEN